MSRPMLCPPDRLDEMFRLRANVWIDEGADPDAFPGGEWRDERDATRLHWVVIRDDQVVGTASLSIHPTLDSVEEGDVYRLAGLSSSGPIAAPARVTVAANHRGRGIAEGLLDAQDAAARAAGAVLAVRQASAALRRLLEARGWRAHGPAPLDARFPTTTFTVMSLQL